MAHCEKLLPFPPEEKEKGKDTKKRERPNCAENIRQRRVGNCFEYGGWQFPADGILIR